MFVRGGNEKTKAYFAPGYFKEGMLRRNDFTRYSARFNIDQTIAGWAGVQSLFAYFNQNSRTDPLSLVLYGTPPHGLLLPRKH